MLRIYRRKMFKLILFNVIIRVSLYQKRWQFSCHLITGKNVMDLSPWDNIKEFLNNSPKSHSYNGNALVPVICNHAPPPSREIAWTLIFRLVNPYFKSNTAGTDSTIRFSAIASNLHYQNQNPALKTQDWKYIYK